MLQTFFKKKIEPKVAGPKEFFWENFINLPYHQWIKEDKYLSHSFQSLFGMINEGILERMIQSRIYFLRANALYSCSLSMPEKGHAILIFPDLFRMLRALVPEKGLAILAHELGHIYHQHSTRGVETLKSQIEADQFVIDLGLGLDLQEVLLDYPESEECQMRLYALNQKLFSKSPPE